nr:MAG TPA: PcfJ like protein [Caudoviricetes sp.]
MLVSQVDIPQMFHSYTALTEDRSLSGYTIQCARCGQEFRIPARRNACAPVHVFCPSCREYINYGWSRAAEDNAWVAHGETVPTDMHLQVKIYKDSVQLVVWGHSVAPIPWEADRYWQNRKYREVFRFDVKARKTTWVSTIDSGVQERELGDPGILLALAKTSMLRYLYKRACIAEYKPDVTALMRTLRDTVHRKFEARVRHKVSSFFCSAGTYAGWLLLPIGNIAYRMVFKDASNLPRIWRYIGSSVTGGLDGFDAILKGFDIDVVRKAKSTVDGIIAASGLPNTRSVRRALTQDPFYLRQLIYLHKLFTRSDIAMQAFPLFAHPTSGSRVLLGSDKLLLLKGMYSDLDILRFLQFDRDGFLVHDTVRMLDDASDAAQAELRRHPPSIRSLHDVLVQIRRREEYPDYIFDNDIAPVRRRLAMQLDRVHFYLPERSFALRDAGDVLHNCVGTYAKQVRDGETHIVLMADERGKLVACIEVKDGTIRQAKLDRNQSVAKDAAINAEVITWAQKIGLQYCDCQDIAPPRADGGVTAATA